MEKDRIKEIADKYVTPAYVFDEGMLKKRVRAIRDILGSSIGLCYSIKANPFLIPSLLDETDALEVCSPGELDICRELNVPGNMIIYSGVSKTKEDVSDAVGYGAKVYTAESVNQVILLNDEGQKAGQVLPVILRLNAGSQFGMSRKDLEYVIKNRNEYANILIEGIHYFAGTQRKKTKDRISELNMLREFFKDIKDKYGLTLKKLEYGPGLPYPYFEGEDFTDTLEPLRQIIEELKKTSDICELTVEMGRFIASECGYYLTHITDKKIADKTNYLIIDGGINHINYLGNVMGMKVPVVEHVKCEKTGTENRLWTICGSLCTTGDVPIRQIELTDPEVGDLLAFKNIGAYSVTEGIYLFLSRVMPKIILIKEDGKDVVLRDSVKTSTLNTPEN
ncbi:MAG: alanine racemase [Lachnospiraceae bacterium]|nr:alanine racemase [Lachnospiraceae bacterium]